MVKKSKKVAQAAVSTARGTFDVDVELAFAHARVLELQRRDEHQQASIEIVVRELRDAERARDAAQELLDACLSPDVDAKFTPHAVAVRNVLCRMLDRMGWLDHSAASALKLELEAVKRELKVANMRIAVVERTGRKPSAVVVSADGEVAGVSLDNVNVTLAK